MSNRFRINTDKIIKDGIHHVDFDPSKVVLMKDESKVYDNIAERYIVYKYEDSQLSRMIEDLGYYMSWDKTNNVKNDARRDGGELYIIFSSVTNLRKRPNKDEFTQKSLDERVSNEKRLDAYDVDYAGNEFKKAIEAFNAWYVEKQQSQTIERFACTGTWNFDDDKDIVAMEEEEKQLKERIYELRQKRFDRQCDIMVEYIQGKENEVSQELIRPLVEAVSKNKEEGFKNSFRGFL